MEKFLQIKFKSNLDLNILCNITLRKTTAKTLLKKCILKREQEQIFDWLEMQNTV